MDVTLSQAPTLSRCLSVLLPPVYSRVYWQKLETLSDRDAEWWTFNDQRRAELKALGWRMEMGKWVAPNKEALR